MTFFPYDDDGNVRSLTPAEDRFLWMRRTSMRDRQDYGEKIEDRVVAGRRLRWFEHSMFFPERYRVPLSIAFAFKATHNHFALDGGGKVFKQTAPAIKLPADATEEQHLTLLAQLNSSVGDFWVKQTCHNCGYSATGGGGRTTAEPWDDFYERDAGKLESFPLATESDPDLEAFAKSLHRLATERSDDSAMQALALHAENGSAQLRAELEARRSRDTKRLFQMVSLQEELDWLCYKLYGIDQESDWRSPDALLPIAPGLRPFEISLAQDDVERREAISRGEEPDDLPTEWFSRHGWELQTTLDALPESERAIVQARIGRAQASRDLLLLEQPTFKRRWYRPDYQAEEREAIQRWLDSRLEVWAKGRSVPFTAAQAGAALRSNAGILAAGELLSGRGDFDIDALIAERLRLGAVPNNKHHVFKREGLLKRAEWERTWEQQRMEDGGDAVAPNVPPEYAKEDFLKKEYWELRGKLDVPKERFIAFTEVPAPTGEEVLYAWAGWTPRERAKAMLGLDEQLEAAGVPVADRHGLLYGVWFPLPYVAWESADAARDFRADVRSLVGENGVTKAMLDEWAKRFPSPKGGKPSKPKAPSSEAPKAKKGTRAKTKAKEEEDAAT